MCQTTQTFCIIISSRIPADVKILISSFARSRNVFSPSSHGIQLLCLQLFVQRVPDISLGGLRSSFISWIFAFFQGVTAPSGPRHPHYWGFMITFRHTTLGMTPLDMGSARHGDLYLTTHNTHKRQLSITPAGFEPAVPKSERPHTHSLELGGHWIFVTGYM